MCVGNFSVRIVQAKRHRLSPFRRKRISFFRRRSGIAVVSRSGGVMDISCLEVIRELSNYIDKDVTPNLREQILAHLSGCSRCTAVYDGLRNIITLTGDGRAFDLPEGFSQHLRAKLAKE